MANPKKRTSTRKRNQRRSHHRLSGPTLIRCSNCQEMTVRHRVCSYCGFYKGSRIVDTGEE